MKLRGFVKTLGNARKALFITGLILVVFAGCQSPANPVKELKYTVTYDNNGATGGEVPTDTATYAPGDSVTLAAPGDLVKTGENFDGWTVKADGSGTVLKAGDKYIMPKADVTFHAKWIDPPTFTVTYNGNGATGTAPTDTTRHLPKAEVTLAGRGDLAKAGQTFEGWTVFPDGSGPVFKAGSKYPMPALNVTLYAKWIDPPTYSVTYNGNGGTGTAPTDTAKYASGAEVTLADKGDLVKRGRTFKGWTVKKDGTGPVLTPGGKYPMAAKDATFYAKWEASVFSVTYDGNGSTGGTAPTDISKYTTGAEITLAGRGDLVKTGKTFDGWTVKKDGSGPVLKAGAKYPMAAKDATFYAKWIDPPTYSVTYNGYGATSGTAPTDTAKYASGAEVTLADKGDLVKTGRTFKGWTEKADGTGPVLKAGAKYPMAAKDATFYAKWEASVFSVTYDGNGSTGGTAPTDISKYTTGAEITLAGRGDLVKTGHTFDGWTEKADGTGPVLKAGAKYPMAAKDATFYAKWIVAPPPRYTVTYHANGATSGAAPVDTTMYLTGGYVRIPGKETLAKTGHTFAGWTMRWDGKGTVYWEGDWYRMGTANVAFYVRWQ